eukprot:scaffold25141_cov96-Isochrysis_galbana.AAC.2
MPPPCHPPPAGVPATVRTMTGPDRSTVEAYVEKHRLAEELSNALNKAIREQSEDPFAVRSREGACTGGGEANT